MKTLRAILIDDEEPALSVLRKHLEIYCPQVKLVAECNESINAPQLIHNLKPDLVFLDIEMPRLNAFQLLDELGEIHFSLIFTTAYDHFAIKAFKYSALDYLLKPIVVSELILAVQRAYEKKYIHPQQVEILQDSLHATPKRIALSFQDGYQFVAPNEIVFCEAESNYTKFHLQNENILLIVKTLKEVEEVLSDLDFFRIHRHYLINLNHIKKYVKTDGGYVVMSNQKTITVSRSRKDEFTQLFSKF